MYNMFFFAVDEDLGIDFTQCEGACLNKMYSTFSLGYNGTENVCVLVRANNDGTDANGDRIAVTHKLEYAPEFGAEVLPFHCMTVIIQEKQFNLFLFQKIIFYNVDMFCSV